MNIENLIKTHLINLSRFTYALIGNKNDGDDIVQDVIIIIMQKYPHITESDEFLKLSYRLIKNKCIDKYRSSKRYKHEEIGNILDKNSLDKDEKIKFKIYSQDQEKLQSNSAEEDLIEMEIELTNKKRAEIAQGCLNDIKNIDHKEILILFSQGLKYAEISEKLDIPLGTVMSGLARARKSVAECVKRKIKK